MLWKMYTRKRIQEHLAAITIFMQLNTGYIVTHSLTDPSVQVLKHVVHLKL